MKEVSKDQQIKYLHDITKWILLQIKVHEIEYDSQFHAVCIQVVVWICLVSRQWKSFNCVSCSVVTCQVLKGLCRRLGFYRLCTDYTAILSALIIQPFLHSLSAYCVSKAANCLRRNSAPNLISKAGPGK